MDPNYNRSFNGPVPNGSGGPPAPAFSSGPRPSRNSPDPAQVPDPLRPSAAASRAQKYDDEKRRIAASCFGKLDEQGKPLQSYITHIRVEEDAVYQSSPPPPGHPPHHKKPRIIIVAVKNNGRVSMHKARENDDTTFQIGKTWPLEELQSIESFSNLAQRTAEDEVRAKWAGPTGFIISMTKPYYWQAKTAKEKDFFVSSLVKIYNKYTEGRVPQLIGFEPRVKDEIIAATKPPDAFQAPLRSDALPPPLSTGPPTGPRPPYAQDRRPTSPSVASDARSASVASNDVQRPSLSGPRPYQNPRPSPSQTPPPQSANRSRMASPQLSQRPSQEQMLRQKLSQDLDQNRAAYTKSPPPSNNNVYPGRQTPQGSRTNLGDTISPPLPPIISPRRQAERSRARPDPNGPAVASIPPLEPRSLSTVPTNTSERSYDSTNSNNNVPRSVNTPPPLGNATARNLPERRRPPLSEGDRTSRDIEPPLEQHPAQRPGFTFRNHSTSSNKELTAAPSILQALGAHELPDRSSMPTSRELESQKDTTTLPSAATTKELESPQSDRDIAPEQIAAAMPPSFSPLSTRPSALPSATAPPATANPISTAPVTSPPVTAPPATSPPVTSPPVTSPPITSPPITSPPITSPPTTSPPATTPRAASPAVTSATPTSTSEPQSESEPQFRPGLGPMMGSKKADVASKFRKAVVAHTAFKPRAGGAGDRLFSAQTKATNEPDGITGVVPARSVTRDLTPKEPITAEKDFQQQQQQPPPQTEKAISVVPPETPSIQIDSPITPDMARNVAPKDEETPARSPSPQNQAQSERQRPSRSPQRISKKRQSNPFEPALTAMGIDPSALQGRQTEYEDVLNEFGWDKGFLQSKKMKTLETTLKREIDRLEAGSWLGRSDQKDERVDFVENLLDKTITECEEMEGLLTLYSVELSTLNDDIAFIEAQSQGLQVQTANQKLLQTELQGLVDTISLNTSQLEPLRGASLNDVRGIDSIEQALLLLYKALRTVDPYSFDRENAAENLSTDKTNSMAGMRALQERKDSYLSETNTFLHRLRHYVDPTYGAAFQRTKDAFAGTSTNSRNMVQLHDLARAEMWRYGPLMLFAKEVNGEAWQDMIRAYQGRARDTYQEEVRQSMQEWKRRARKITGEEHDTLFTAQEKETDGLTSTARKLTVKRSQTLAKGLRQTSNEKRNFFAQNQEANQQPFEVFAGALAEMLPVIITEQHFFVDFFHATTLQDLDFPDAVASEAPGERHGTDLLAKRPLEPDRNMARRVSDSMGAIFSPWQTEMQSLIDWAVKQDQFQCVGILCALERASSEHADTSQEFMSKTLTKLHDTLMGTFTRFMEDQVRAIEATKVNIKKRKGVMAFIKVFPNFSALVENMLPPANEVAAEKLEIRSKVDEAYERINRAMFSSLKQIAKEGPHVGHSLNAPNTGVGIGLVSNADPEDKEALNHEILLIENMYYYYTEVDERSSSPVLGVWRGKAMLEMSEHQDRYVSAVIRRPLGRLLDFVEGVEALLTTAHADARNIPVEHPTFSRAALKKLSSSYEPRECRKGIDALKKRIEKHFGESSEDLNINHRLMTQILGECERKYLDAFGRMEKLARDVYGGEADVEFSKMDISSAFKR